MSKDTIYRQAAIDAARQYCIDNLIEDADYHSDGIEYELNNLPSAEPERKKGRLINPTPYGECSECGYLIDSREGYNFCPNCGADMRTRTCEGCKYDSLSWDEEPCDSCTSGDMRGEEE